MTSSRLAMTVAALMTLAACAGGSGSLGGVEVRDDSYEGDVQSDAAIIVPVEPRPEASPPSPQPDSEGPVNAYAPSGPMTRDVRVLGEMTLSLALESAPGNWVTLKDISSSRPVILHDLSSGRRVAGMARPGTVDAMSMDAFGALGRRISDLPRISIEY